MTKPITQSTKTTRGVELRTPKLHEPPLTVTLDEPPSKLTVACVWDGSDGTYPIEYVERLRNMVARNLDVPHDFVCITKHDKVPEGIVRMRPPVMEKGWWQKVGLFSPDLFGPSQRVLYLDLDVVIIKNLFDVVRAQDAFCMIENFGMNKGHAAHNSSCMLWTPTPETAAIYESFSADVTKMLHGDQCWIWRVMQDHIRNWSRSLFVSHKYEKLPRYSFRNDDTSVIVFHGQPKPHQVKEAEIVENWK